MDTYTHTQAFDPQAIEAQKRNEELIEVKLERNRYMEQVNLWRRRAYKWLAVALVTALCLVATSVDVQAKTEDDWNRAWCAEQGGRAEVRLADRTRVDCLTDEYAIEADFAGKALKPYEALGQAVHYSRMTGKKPGMLLIVTEPRDCRHVRRARLDASVTGVWVSGLALQPIRVWTTGGACDD